MRRALLHRIAGAGLLALAGFTVACQPADPPPADAAAPEATFDAAAYRAEIQEWRRERIDRLRAEDGWLSLVGLWWLQEGANPVGSHPDSRVLLPAGKAPERVGVIELNEGAAVWIAEPDAGVVHSGQPVSRLELVADADGGPTELELGDLVFYLIRRDDRYGVRVKDRKSPNRLAFEGIDSFPIDPTWRFAARFEEYDPPRQIPIANVVGQVTDTPSWGAVRFEHQGAEHRLDVLAEPGDDRLFIIFADRTNGSETYGAGRYLYADAPSAAGVVIVDFNRAYNPPCVFTEFATCPLPPPQNRLAIAVPAGEKTWGEEH